MISEMSTEGAPPREVALVFCMFFSVFVVVSSLFFAVYAGPLSPTGWPSLATAAAATGQGGAAFFWLRGPLHVGASMGWSEIFAMWRNGRVSRGPARVWLLTTTLLPISFVLQGVALKNAEESAVVWGALILASQVALYLGVISGLVMSGMQNRTILLQDI